MAPVFLPSHGASIEPRAVHWLPGIHQPLVTVEEFEAAHRGRVPGRKRGRDLMSGRVVCGLCGRRMSVDQNGKGQKHYRCRHRGSGCGLPVRSANGLLKAAGLGMALLCDAEVREAIRRHLEDRRRPAPQGRRRRAPEVADRLAGLHEQRRKLLQLHYADRLSAEQFGEEQARLTNEIDNLEADVRTQTIDRLDLDDLTAKFDQISAMLDDLNIAELWDEATEVERRKLLDELLSGVTVHPD